MKSGANPSSFPVTGQGEQGKQSADSAEMYSGGKYLERNPSWHVEDSPWKARQILKMLDRNQLSPRSVCEVGCGAGEILAQLHDRLPGNVRFAGFEISPQAYELCRSRARERLQFFLADLCTEPAEKFDLVLAIDVFEHVEDYYGFLRRIRDKGTFKLFHIPLDMCVHKIARGGPIMRLRHQVGHIHYFMKETALATLTDTGYEIQDWFYTSEDIDVKPHSWKARFARLPRALAFKVQPDWTARTLGGFALMVLAK
jgi:cyclopropane fatty-acyl-phospholipid synthase-like methyltransferase